MVATIILLTIAAYLAIGVLFALLFVIRGVERIDPAARSTSWVFRMLIIPGAAALWPVILSRWVHARAPEHSQ